MNVFTKNAVKMIKIVHNVHFSVRFLLLTSLIVALIGVANFSEQLGIQDWILQKNKEIKIIQEKIKIADDLQKKTEQEQELGNFVAKSMDDVGVSASVPKKQLMAQAIVRVLIQIFDNQELRYNYVTLIAIESRFDPKAKSPVGARGMSQIMPQYAKEFAKKCGIDDFTDNDLDDMELNLLVGACQFRALLESPNINGNVQLALAAYNAGPGSKAFRSLVGMRNDTNVETAWYIAKHGYLLNKTLHKVAENK
jgi:membrane-bound lytic murein transglycosylase MltF